MIVLGGTSVTSPVSLDSLAQFAKPIMNNLGITVQANLKFDCKIKAAVKARCFHLRQLHVCNLYEMQLHVFYQTPLKFEHIMQVLAPLHWLPVNFIIHFKMILFAFKAIRGLAQKYYYHDQNHQQGNITSGPELLLRTLFNFLEQ